MNNEKFVDLASKPVSTVLYYGMGDRGGGVREMEGGREREKERERERERESHPVSWPLQRSRKVSQINPALLLSLYSKYKGHTV